MQILEFRPVTMGQFARISDALKSKGLNVSGTQGEVKAFGADVKFDLTEPLLTITVVKAPHFRRLEQFAAQIREAVTALLDSPV
jgi:alpha/beta superfamily hydrolase